MWAICISNLMREKAARLSLQCILKVSAWPPPMSFSAKKHQLNHITERRPKSSSFKKRQRSLFKSCHFSPLISPRKNSSKVFQGQQVSHHNARITRTLFFFTWRQGSESEINSHEMVMHDTNKLYKHAERICLS